MRLFLSAAASILALAVSASGSLGASALQKECTAKYHSAQGAGTLNGMSYNQFYSQCAAEARSGKAGGATPAASGAPPAGSSTPVAAAAPIGAPVAAASAPAPGGAVFPTAVSSEFASDKPGKARMQTCLAQYKKNKETNSNGGLKWIQKGGGYYSECNKRLKG